MSEPILDEEEPNKKSTQKEMSEIEVDDTDKVHDFPSMFAELFKSVPWKLSIYLFILLLLIYSKQFVEHVLYPIGKDKWVDGDQPTNVGTIMLCIFAALGLIVLDLFIRSGIL